MQPNRFAWLVAENFFSFSDFLCEKRGSFAEGTGGATMIDGGAGT